MTSPTTAGDDTTTWAAFLRACIDQKGVAAAEARLRTQWRTHEHQQGIRR